MWGVSASHIPVLVYLAKKYKPKTILEFGSGELSTLLFLDKSVFSKLIKVISVEEDPEWALKMQTLTKGNSRVSIIDRVPAQIHGFDMIFIDGPQNSERRGKIIGYVMRQAPASIIVIHDIENPDYRRFLDTRSYYEYVFDPVESPKTGVYSLQPLPNIVFGKINRLMRKRFDELEENWSEWNKLL
jgi:predicted O-methyltransferase YrrM